MKVRQEGSPTSKIVERARSRGEAGITGGFGHTLAEASKLYGQRPASPVPEGLRREFGRSFGDVVFAIAEPSSSRRLLAPFKDVFGLDWNSGSAWEHKTP